jgi:hypothetical protein
MIDDAKIRQQILKNLQMAGTVVEPWRVEMEEIDFGDVVGATLRMAGGELRRFRASAKAKDREFKSEGRIAFELSQQIKAALASTPDAPLTTLPNGKIVRADGDERHAASASK